MAKKIFNYKGKTLEELQAMSHDEVAQLLPSRQRRKMQRGFSEDEKGLLETLQKKGQAKTHLRDMIVLPEMIGKTIKIHNGQKFQDVIIQEEALGCYLGELVLTRKRLTHGNAGVGATRSSASVSVR
jgi:small subunit ribosomal protein S19